MDTLTPNGCGDRISQPSTPNSLSSSSSKPQNDSRSLLALHRALSFGQNEEQERERGLKGSRADPMRRNLQCVVFSAACSHDGL